MSILVPIIAIGIAISCLICIASPKWRLARFLGPDCSSAEINLAKLEYKGGIWRVGFPADFTDNRVLRILGLRNFTMTSSNIQTILTQEISQYWNIEGSFNLYIGGRGDFRWVLIRQGVVYIGELNLD